MKKLFFALVALLAITSCDNKIEAEGPITMRDYTVSSGASAISVSSAIKLTLTDQVPAGQVEITTNENIFNYIRVADNGAHVVLSLVDGNNYKDVDIEVRASSNQYNEIKASGASMVDVSGVNLSFEGYSVELSGASWMNVASTLSATTTNIVALGASRINLENLITDALTVEFSGASEMNVSATQHATTTSVVASGASRMSGDGFTTDALNVDLAGGSEVSMGVNSALSGNLTGASIVNYWGEATVSASTSGGSEVKKIR